MPKAVLNPNDAHDTNATMLRGNTVTIHPTTKEGKQVKTTTKQGALCSLFFCKIDIAWVTSDIVLTQACVVFLMFSMSLLIGPYRYKGVYVASNSGNRGTSTSSSSTTTTTPLRYYVQVVKDNATYTLPDKYNTAEQAATAFDRMAVALGTRSVLIAPLEVDLFGCRSKY